MPLQHLADRVLKRMQAPREPQERRGDSGPAAVEKFPNLPIATTSLSGFPGETEAEFEELAARLRGRERVWV